MPTPRPLILTLALSTALSPAFAAPARDDAGATTTSRIDDVNAASPGRADDAMLRAQILLDRAHFSPGEIDATPGSNSRRAIAGFQASRGLTVNGELDAPTWEALDRDGKPALIRYTLMDADVAGPFEPIPDDMMEKAKLPALGFTSVQELLGERFHASPSLLQAINPGKTFAAGEEIVVPNVLGDATLAKADKVVVDQSDATVSLVDATGKTYAQFPATMGSEHDPLPLGEWKIQGVARNPPFHYNPELFWDADSKQEKATLAPGPNNPVGVVWIDLSKAHYGIHGTPVPSTVGKTASHGCIRLTNWDAQSMSQAVASGTVAILQE